MEKRFQKRDFSGRLRRSIRVFGSEKVYDIWPRGRLQLSSSIKEQAIAPYWVLRPSTSYFSWRPLACLVQLTACTIGLQESHTLKRREKTTKEKRFTLNPARSKKVRRESLSEEWIRFTLVDWVNPHRLFYQSV
eukprot:scaffold77538_cov74-Cyclotella_meneghiniana.AAC.1